MKTFDKNTIRNLTQDDLSTSTLSEAINLIKWTLVDAIEMNPESREEVQDAWAMIVERL